MMNKTLNILYYIIVMIDEGLEKNKNKIRHLLFPNE